MKKILLIEDDYPLRLGIIKLFEKRGFTVLAVADGKSGMILAKELIPDLILCDIMLPDINGYEIFSSIKNIPLLTDVPFLFITALSNVDDIQKGLRLGVDDYITKPFNNEDLVARVQNKIAGHRKSKNNTGTQSSHESDSNETFLIRTNGQPKLINYKDIVVIVAKAEYTEVFMKDSSKILVRKLLKEWEQFLPPQIFKRIHRGTIINFNYIEKLEKSSSRSLLVKLTYCDNSFVMSDRYAQKFRKELLF